MKLIILADTDKPTIISKMLLSSIILFLTYFILKPRETDYFISDENWYSTDKYCVSIVKLKIISVNSQEAKKAT